MKIQNITSGANGVQLRISDIYSPENFKDTHYPHALILDPTEEAELQDSWRTIKSREEGDIYRYEQAGLLAVTDEPVYSSDLKAKLNEVIAEVNAQHNSGITPLP